MFNYANNLNYEIAIEKNGKLKEKQSVIKVKADLNEKFLTEGSNPFLTTKNYALANDFICDVEVETVIDTIAKPIDFESEKSLSNISKLEDILNESVRDKYIKHENENYQILKLKNIQQPTDAKNKDRFVYTAVYSAISDTDQIIGVRQNVEIVQIEDEFIVNPLSEFKGEISAITQVPINDKYSIKYMHKEMDEVNIDSATIEEIVQNEEVSETELVEDENKLLEKEFEVVNENEEIEFEFVYDLKPIKYSFVNPQGDQIPNDDKSISVKETNEQTQKVMFKTATQGKWKIVVDNNEANNTKLDLKISRPSLKEKG